MRKGSGAGVATATVYTVSRREADPSVMKFGEERYSHMIIIEENDVLWLPEGYY